MKIFNYRAVQVFIASLLIFFGVSSAYAFTCQADGKSINTSGSLSVRVTLPSTVQAGISQALSINLGSSIQCKNDDTKDYTDPIRIGSDSNFIGDLNGLYGSITYYDVAYPFPLTSATYWQKTSWGNYQPWNAILYLSTTGSASGNVIKQGDTFAQMVLEKENTKTGGVSQTITWNLIANNTVTVPAGGCSVSAKSVTVQLPDYPGSQQVPLTVSCTSSESLSYYLTGTTTDTASTIFTNTASASPAQGVGVQLSNSSGILATNKTISLGTVGTSGTDLGLTATYARTSGQVTAGNVQSIIGLTFVYQ